MVDKSYPAVLGWELTLLRGARARTYVSDNFGFDLTLLSQWENGRLVPTLPYLVRLVRHAYTASVEDLLIKVAESTVWDPKMVLPKFPEGLQVLAAIPEEQRLLRALVAHDLASLVPLHTLKAKRKIRKRQDQELLRETGIDLSGFAPTRQRIDVAAELLRSTEPRDVNGLARSLGLDKVNARQIVKTLDGLGWLQPADPPAERSGRGNPCWFFTLSELGIRHAQAVAARYSSSSTGSAEAPGPSTGG